MKKKMTQKSIETLQLIYCFSFSYTLFFMYDIWQLGDSILGYLIYFASFPIIRLIYIPLATLFVIHNKISMLLKLSFVSNILMALSVIFLFPLIDNTLVIPVLYALFAVIFTSSFQTGYNYVIATYVEENKMEKFFYTTGFYRNIADTVLPILLGLIIVYVAKDAAYILLILISIWTILYLNTYEKVDTGKQDIAFKELFRKDGTSNIPKHIAVTHLIFIVVYNTFVHVFEVYGTSYLYTLATNDVDLAVYKVISVITVGAILFTKTKLPYTEQFWVVVASIGTVITLILGYLGGGAVVGVIAIAAILLMYVFQNSFTSLSFRLMSGENTKNRIIVLFQREMLRAVGKGIMGIILLFVPLASGGIFSSGFYILTALVLGCLVVSFIFYVIIDNYITVKTP